MRKSSQLYHKLFPLIDILFYTEPQDIPIEDDGERSIDKEFRRNIIRGFEHEIDSGHFSPLYRPNFYRLKGTVNERMETILNAINYHNGK